jgi:hypothetical protein
MVSARRRKSLSAEEILSETCADTLSDVPSDTFSDSDGEDDNVDNESDSDVEPETARKIKKTVRHLSSDSESGSVEQRDSSDVSDIYASGRLQYGKNKTLFQT